MWEIYHIRYQSILVETDEREWKEEWLEQLRQVDFITRGVVETKEKARTPIDKIPYKFKYKFKDESGRSSTMTIEDWEVGALYRNCLERAEGDELLAIRQVTQKYDDIFRHGKDISLFLGTTLEHHRQRHNNPFTIIGVFYPSIDKQGELFS